MDFLAVDAWSLSIYTRHHELATQPSYCKREEINAFSECKTYIDYKQNTLVK